MTLRTERALVAALALLAALPVAAAQDAVLNDEPVLADPPPRFSATLSIGTEVGVDGNVGLPVRAVAVDANDAVTNAALNALFGPSVGVRDISTTAADFTEALGRPVTGLAELGYALDANTEVFVALRYYSAESEGPIAFGTIRNSADAQAARVPVTADFSDFTAWSGELGVRTRLTDWAVRPFVGARVGVLQASGIDVVLAAPSLTGAVPRALQLTEDSTTWLAGVDAGLEYRLGDTVAISAETGLRYVGELAAADDGLRPFGLQGLGGIDGRWSTPLALRGTVRF
jgi:hypothetical protein